MSEEAIFTEVDEELRRERMRAMWRRFAPWIIGAAVLVVALVAANEGWNWYQKSTAATASDQFYTAAELAEDGDIAGALAAFEAVSADGVGKYPLLARFRQASLLAEDGKAEQAVAAYDALANESSEPRVRELALILAAYQLVDDGDVVGVRSRVEGIVDGTNPMRMAAREAIGLAQFASGDADAARATFAEAILDPTGNSEVLGRMQVYVAQLTAQGAADPNPVEAGAETEAEAATAQ